MNIILSINYLHALCKKRARPRKPSFYHPSFVPNTRVMQLIKQIDVFPIILNGYVAFVLDGIRWVGA